jgi:hypothetical protein
MRRAVWKKFTDVAEVLAASITRIALMMEVASTSETSVNFYQHDATTQKTAIFIQLNYLNFPLKYIGQTGCTFNTRFKGHVQAIRNNRPNSGYSQHNTPWIRHFATRSPLAVAARNTFPRQLQTNFESFPDNCCISRDCRLTGYFIINVWKCYLLFELPCIMKHFIRCV